MSHRIAAAHAKAVATATQPITIQAVEPVCVFAASNMAVAYPRAVTRLTDRSVQEPSRSAARPPRSRGTRRPVRRLTADGRRGTARVRTRCTHRKEHHTWRAPRFLDRQGYRVGGRRSPTWSRRALRGG